MPHNVKIYELEKTYPTISQTGVALSDFFIDYQKYVHDNDNNISDLIKDQLHKNGIVIVKNAELTQGSDIEGWANIWGTEEISYAGGTNDREAVGNSILTTGTEPPQMNVAAHNEMSYTYYDLYPRIFMLGCVTAPNQKGETIFTNNVDFTNAFLKSAIGQKFLNHGVMYIRNYYDQNNPEAAKAGLFHWQGAFNTDDPEKVTDFLKSMKIDKIQWLPDGGLRFSYQRDAFEWDDIINMNLSFISTGNHGYWFRNWAPFCDLPDHERPHHLTFGDGSELSELELEEFTDLIVAHSLEHLWEDNDLVIIDNLRYMHARKPFKLNDNEEREIYVSMRIAEKRHGMM